MFVIKRSPHNPILAPDHNDSFESYATFNPSPVKTSAGVVILYRAQSDPEPFQGGMFSLSSIGVAVLKNGSISSKGTSKGFVKRERLIIPEEPWERYGCEDPRVTKIDGKYFIFYTALSGYPFGAESIKVGLAISKDLKSISEKHLVTPFNAKAMTLFPEKIGGKYVALLTVNTDRPPSQIAIAEFDRLEDMWSVEYWNAWYKKLDKHIIRIPKLESDQVEIGAVPVKTKDGWLLVYSHIQHYMSDHKIFGIEAVLLDRKNIKKVIGKTRGPFLVPEESYERYGTVPKTIFPSGALLEKDTLSIYYGATDTTCARADIGLAGLLESMKFPHDKRGDFERVSKKPLLAPRKGAEFAWEAKAVFNPAAILIGNTTHILYRAMSNDNTSVIGHAEMKNGRDISFRSDKPIYVPRENFEDKKVPGGNSGCEDPRLVTFAGKIYMYYTAYNGVNAPAIAMTSITVADFAQRNWKWTKPVIVTADGVDDKDGFIHPERVFGKCLLYHRVHHMICGDFGSNPAFPEKNTFKNIPIMAPRPGMWDSKKVGMSVPPIKIEYKKTKGWLVLYHGISDDNTYRVGAALLDYKDPMKVVARTTDYVFEPQEKYEKSGQVGNVVFPCGAVVKKDTLYMYYGGADSVINAAKISLKKLLGMLIG